MSAVMSRRAVLAAAVLAAASGCAPGGNGALPPGWERKRIGAVTIPVPRDWNHSATTDRYWTDLWGSPDGGNRLLAVQVQQAQDQEQVLTRLRQSLRVWATGFSPGAGSTTEIENGTCYSEPFSTTTAGVEQGRLWLVRNAEEGVAVALLGTSLDEQVLSVLEAELKVDAPSAAPALRPGWVRVRRDQVSVSVPDQWKATGAPVGSSRWTAGWADAELDGTTKARLLLATNLGEQTVVDVLARIESDAVAGSLPGYERQQHAPTLVLGRLRGSRVRFSYEKPKWEGVLWVLSDGTSTAAVQLAFAGPLQEDVVAGVEESIWFRA